MHACMDPVFAKAFLDLVKPGLQLHALRPWRLPGTRAIQIVAPSLKIESAIVLFEEKSPELVLCEDEDKPALRLHYPRVKELAPVNRVIYERVGFGLDEIIPLPGRPEEEKHLPICLCDVTKLGLCTEAIGDFLRAHGERAFEPDYEATESRVVRGHAIHIEFPLYTMTWTELQPQEPVRRDPNRVGRNALCPCGSGKKFKKCHLGRAN